MPNKPKEEVKNRYYFEMFRKDYPLPVGTICYRDKPDVILKGERKIGIEITNFYMEEGKLPQSEQVQRERRDQAVAEAQRIYQAKNGKRFRMTLSFNKINPILDKRNLVEKIVDLANDFGNYLKTGQSRKFSAGSKNTFKVILGRYNIPELSHISIDFVDAEWMIITGHNTELMSMDKLKKIIKKKEGKLEGYERCDAYWLLVVVDFSDRAQDQEIQVDDFERIDSTDFEKILVYKPQFRHIFEVK